MKAKNFLAAVLAAAIGLTSVVPAGAATAKKAATTASSTKKTTTKKTTAKKAEPKKTAEKKTVENPLKFNQAGSVSYGYLTPFSNGVLLASNKPVAEKFGNDAQLLTFPKGTQYSYVNFETGLTQLLFNSAVDRAFVSPNSNYDYLGIARNFVGKAENNKFLQVGVPSDTLIGINGKYLIYRTHGDGLRLGIRRENPGASDGFDINTTDELAIKTTSVFGNAVRWTVDINVGKSTDTSAAFDVTAYDNKDKELFVYSMPPVAVNKIEDITEYQAAELGQIPNKAFTNTYGVITVKYEPNKIIVGSSFSVGGTYYFFKKGVLKPFLTCVVENQKEVAYDGSTGLVIVARDGSKGWYSVYDTQNAKQLIAKKGNVTADSVGALKSAFTVKVDGVAALYSKTGTKLTTTKYSDIKPVSSTYAAVYLKDSKGKISSGVITSAGKIFINPNSRYSGFAVLGGKVFCGYNDDSGKPGIIADMFDANLNNVKRGSLYLLAHADKTGKDTVAITKSGEKYGIVDLK